MKHFLNRIIPFIMIGIAVVAFAFGIMILAYLLFFGAIIGFILFTIRWVHDTFFAKKKAVKTRKPSGRIIDSDDWKEL